MAAAAFLRFRFVFDKGKVFRKRVRRWEGYIRDLRWAWPICEEAVVEFHRRIFDSEGATSLVSGGPWTPLHEMTVMARLRGEQVSETPPYDYLGGSGEGPEGRVLHWSHRLRDAVADPKATADSVRIGTATSFEFGATVEYGQIHQVGGTNQWGKSVAPRPWLDYVGGPTVAVGILELALQAKMAS